MRSFRLSAAILFLTALFGGHLFALSSDIHITDYITADSGELMGISWEKGFVISPDNGKSWNPKNNGIPNQVVYPFNTTNPIPLTSFGADPTDFDRIAATSSWGMYVTENRGRSWSVIQLGEPISTSAYVTSVAVSPHDKNTYLLGTSFSGIFITRDKGKTWTDLEIMTRPLYRGAGFREEISSIAFHPGDPNTAYVSVGFGRGIYRADLVNQTLTKIEFPGDAGAEYTHQLTITMCPEDDACRFVLTADTDGGRYEFNPVSKTWTRKSPKRKFTPPLSPEKRERLKKAADKTGIYLKSWNAEGQELLQFIALLKEHGMNSIVVDVKDDFGRVTYDTALEMPYDVGAVVNHIDIHELIDAAHENGIYVIGRMVCFQDPRLYKYNNYKYAVWNTQTGGPWGHKFKRVDPDTEEETWVQREFWVDTFSEDVWNYNISIAEELEGLGIDEIQFDYIRFPSDGNMWGISWRYQKEGMMKIDALESFLRLARERLTVPISTDLYGFNSWYRMGNWIGQNIEMVSHYVDAVSPMYYPSHFPRDFIKELGYFDRAKLIYSEGSDRAAAIVEGRSVIRPYVQAFLIGGEVNFEYGEYSYYLIQQLEGVKEGNASGFTLWNNSNRYYMITQSLKPYTQKSGEGTADTDLLD